MVPLSMGQRVDATAIKGGREEKYYSIPFNIYRHGDIVVEDLYLRYQGQYLVYRPKDSQWSDEDQAKLVEFGAKELFIKCESEEKHFKFLESNLSRILKEESTPTKEKASVLYQTATGIAKNIFASPMTSETFTRSKKVVNYTMDLLAKDSGAFFDMISLSSHDYYTYTHCVNVMTFTLGLLTALGTKDKKILEECAIGAFLHDVGKSKVPIEILNKPGPLTEEEWKVMKKHPEYGIDILGNRPIPPRGKEIVLQHHEKVNGIGYPYGLRGEQIPMFSQVVSICDAYDAMTTNRCYQKAKSPFQAFLIITQEMKGHFNPNLVESFIKLLNIERKRHSG